MDKKPLLNLLATYARTCTEECGTVKRVCDFIRSQPACFDRATAAGHLTGSAWVVDRTGTRVLLTLHSKVGKWVQLGGHVGADRDMLAAALREAREESGIDGLDPVSRDIFDIDIHDIPPWHNEPEHLHYDIRFALRAPAGCTCTAGEESHALAWVPVDGIQRYTREESMLRMAQKWRQYRKRAIPDR